MTRRAPRVTKKQARAALDWLCWECDLMTKFYEKHPDRQISGIHDRKVGSLLALKRYFKQRKAKR